MTLTYGKRTVLENLNFKVRARARIGIHGASGSGKHSIMNLILGIFKHKKGKLTVFGKDINDVSNKEIRELSFFVDQTPTLFAGTVRENIDPNYKYSNSDLIKVLAYLGFYDLIKINSASFKDMEEWNTIQRNANCKMTLMVNLANFIQKQEEKEEYGRRKPSRGMSFVSQNLSMSLNKNMLNYNQNLPHEEKLFNKIYEGLVSDMLMDSKFSSKLLESNMDLNAYIQKNREKRTLKFSEKFNKNRNFIQNNEPPRLSRRGTHSSRNSRNRSAVSSSRSQNEDSKRDTSGFLQNPDLSFKKKSIKKKSSFAPHNKVEVDQGNSNLHPVKNAEKAALKPSLKEHNETSMLHHSNSYPYINQNKDFIGIN